MLKNKKDVIKLNPIITPKLVNERLSVSRSLIPIESPTPKIGPINGDINMAPITTAAELAFRPMDAIVIENTRIHAV